uniref:Uncharacterized protein n=1 Tax=Anguilla anguilla TaxID=7936 RepID=A0A0E9TBA4_ANGAN
MNCLKRRKYYVCC